MVDKLSVNVTVPAAGIEHNFLVPAEMSVECAVALMVHALQEEYPGIRTAALAGNALLQRSTGKVLSPQYSLKQLGIVRGERLLLI